MKVRRDLAAREVQALHEAMSRRLGDTSVPTLPEVAVKVIELVSDQNAGMKDFAEVIRNDQALTGRLLRMSNAAAFAQRNPVTTLDRALVLLGIDRIKALALGFHLSRSLAGEDGPLSHRRIWTLSLYRAWLAFHIANKLDRSIAGEAFISGLMLDVGIPMMEKFAGDQYEQLVDFDAPPLKTFRQEEANLLCSHVDVIAVLAKMWKLPELLVTAIGNHHTDPGSCLTARGSQLLRGITFAIGGLQLDPNGQPGGNAANASVPQRTLGIQGDDLKHFMQLAAKDFQASIGVFSHVADKTVTTEDILEQANNLLGESVEELVEENAAHSPTMGENRHVIGDIVVELEALENQRVRVFIGDTEGNRLSSEEIEPDACDDNTLRDLLMLGDATPQQLSDLRSSFAALAA